MLHNICLEKGNHSELAFRPLSFARIPEIPTAAKLSIARVASPISNDRTYESLFLLALKTHLGRGRYLMKEGDLIGVPINIDGAHHFHDADPEFGDAVYPDEVDSLHYE